MEKKKRDQNVIDQANILRTQKEEKKALQLKEKEEQKMKDKEIKANKNTPVVGKGPSTNQPLIVNMFGSSTNVNTRQTGLTLPYATAMRAGEKEKEVRLILF